MKTESLLERKVNQEQLEQEVAFRYAQNFDYERLADLKNRKIPNSIREFSNEVYKELYLGFEHAMGQGHDLRELKNQGILNPPEGVIQEIYEKFAKSGNFSGIEDVYIGTGFEPKVSNKSAQSGYKSLIKNFCADVALDLYRNYLEIEPKISNRFVQNNYSNYIDLNNNLLEGINQLYYLKELTGFEPRISPNKIRKAIEYLDARKSKNDFDSTCANTYEKAKKDLTDFFGTSI